MTHVRIRFAIKTSDDLPAVNSFQNIIYCALCKMLLGLKIIIEFFLVLNGNLTSTVVVVYNLLLQIKHMLLQVQEHRAQLVVFNLQDLDAVFQFRDALCGGTKCLVIIRELS